MYRRLHPLNGGAAASSAEYKPQKLFRVKEHLTNQLTNVPAIPPPLLLTSQWPPYCILGKRENSTAFNAARWCSLLAKKRGNRRVAHHIHLNASLQVFPLTDDDFGRDVCKLQEIDMAVFELDNAMMLSMWKSLRLWKFLCKICTKHCFLTIIHPSIFMYKNASLYTTFRTCD